MTVLNKNTKKASGWIDAYARATKNSVYEFYRCPSSRKIQAEAIIKNRMLEDSGNNYKIMEGNSSFFTCGYMTNSKLVVFTGFERYEINM